MSKIILFKSRLQEYAQKASLPLPVYESAKEGPEHDPKYKATVIVNGTRYDSASNFSSIKAAEHGAAQIALEDLLKKSDGERDVWSEVHETGLCKNLLQAYAQQMSLPVPVYRTIRSGEIHCSIFMSTVEVAGVICTGGVASTKKEAEIKAARKALMALQPQACDSVSQSATQIISGLQATNVNMVSFQVPISDICPQPGENSQRKRDRDAEVSSEERKAVKPKQSSSISNSTPKNETLILERGLCKNLLQVYAQRMSLPVPVYRFTSSGEGHSPVFLSTVEVAGFSYTGDVASTKKEAEIKAARKALMALQPQPCGFVSQGAAQNISGSQATNSNILGSQVPISNICSQLGEGSQRKRSREVEVASEEHKAFNLKQSTSISPTPKIIIRERGLFKNLLQEYTQKLNLPLPVYSFSMSGDRHSPIFISTVQVSGVSYTGGIASSKKEAESKAAQKALMALEVQACFQAPNQNMSGSSVFISNLSSQLEVPRAKSNVDVEVANEDHMAVKSKQNMSNAGA
ncbi:hypothetical protein KI387_008818, partial [Taxus chinensis]